MKRFLTFLSGLAIVAFTSSAHAQIEWAAGAPGGTSGGSIELQPGDNVFLNTGIPAATVGGNRTDGGTDYTIAAWINSSEDNGLGDATNDRWWFGTEVEGLHLGVFDQNNMRHGHWGSDTSGSSFIQANTWYHVAFAFDADGGSLGTGSISIYVDGVLDGSADSLAPNNSSTNLIIGSRNGSAGPSWGGLIDDVAIFTTVLSAADVSSLASNSSQAVSLGAAAYYDFEDSQTGTTAANAGTLGNALSGIGAPLPPVGEWTAGAPGGTSGGAVLLDGNNHFETGIPSAVIGGNVVDGGVDYTVSAWINSAAESPDFPGSAENNRWWLGTDFQGLHVGVFSPAADVTANSGSTLRHGHWNSDFSGTSVIPVNTWMHVAYSFDADGGSLGTGSVTIYRDGVAETTVDTVAPNVSSADLRLGDRANGMAWLGAIDDVAIFTTALSAADVATLAGDASQAVSLGAAAYFDFEDDQTGTTAANAGTLGFAQLDRIGPSTVSVLKGDVDLDGGVTFLDINPFIQVLSTNSYQAEADCDCDGDVDFLDIQPFINILATQ